MIEKTENELSNIILGCAIEVHKQLGPIGVCLSGMFVL